MLTHALLPGSPAIGAEDPALVPGIGGVPEFDQRGAPFARLAGTRIDIGAFEVQSANGALSADFGLNGQTDGSDFLLWQRNLGKTSGATIRQGDATAGGDVDGNDLAVWRARFGGAAAAPAVSDQLSAVSRAEAKPADFSAGLVGVAQLAGSGAHPRRMHRGGANRRSRQPARSRPHIARNIATASVWTCALATRLCRA